MFKKRVALKKADISMEIQQISIDKSAPRVQHIKIDLEQQIVSNRIQAACSNNVFRNEIGQQPKIDLINEIKKQNLLQQRKKQKTTFQQVQQIIIEQDSQQSKSQPEQKKQKQIIVQQDSEGLQVVEDRGEIQISDQQYEDEIIKKALNKQAYAKLKTKNGRVVPDSDSKQKSLIQQVSLLGVKRNIQKEISIIQRNFQISDKTINSNKNIIKQKKRHLSQKIDKVAKLKNQFNDINKILEFIYARATQIKQFTVEGILHQIAQQEKPSVEIYSDYQ